MQQTSFTSTTADEEYVYADEEHVYAGFPGCCGSVDGVHVPWYGFKSGARADCVGKENALRRHRGIYCEPHRELNDGYHPFVYRGSLLAQQRFDGINGGR